MLIKPEESGKVVKRDKFNNPPRIASGTVGSVEPRDGDRVARSRERPKGLKGGARGVEQTGGMRPVRSVLVWHRSDALCSVRSVLVTSKARSPVRSVLLVVFQEASDLAGWVIQDHDGSFYKAD